MLTNIYKTFLDPVFFASQCGQKGSITPSRTALSVEHVTDRRLTCLGAAVKFSKKNNLLGVFVDAAVLVSLANDVTVC